MSDLPQGSRRWFRVSLRGLMLLVLVVGGGLGWKLHRVRAERQAVALIRAAGGTVQYDYQFSFDPEMMTRVRRLREPAAPRWLRRWVGDDWFQSVASVTVNQPTDATLAAVAEFDGLVDLKLGDVREGVHDWSRLARAGRLEAIWLQCREVDGAAVRALGLLPRLRSVALSANLVVDQDVVQLASQSSIRKLAFHCCNHLTDAGVARLLAAGPPNLETFEWTEGQQVPTRTIAALAQHHPGLRELRLENSLVGDDELRLVGTLTALRRLNCGGTGITAAGLAHLESLTRLEACRISSTAVTGAGMRSVGKLVNLRDLWLEGSDVDDAGLAALADLRHLQRLDLSATRLTDAGLPSLVQFKTLKWLNLGGTRVTSAGLATLGAALPGCNVNAMTLMSVGPPNRSQQLPSVVRSRNAAINRLLRNQPR